MPEDDFTDEEETDDSDSPDLVRKLRGVTRSQAKTIKELQSQVDESASLRRDLAFIQADLPKTKMTDYFREHYTGDNDPTAIRAAATELGLLEGTSAEVTAEVNQIGWMSDAALGAEPTPSLGSEDALREAMAKAAKKAGPKDAAFAIEEVMRQHGRSTITDFR